MPEIKIKNIPQDLINRIDSLVPASECPDRSAFVVMALREYCLYHDQYFRHCLPDITRILCEGVIQKHLEADKKDAEKSRNLVEHVLVAIDQLNNFFSGSDVENDDSS
jgi:hypothetical protein